MLITSLERAHFIGISRLLYEVGDWSFDRSTSRGGGDRVANPGNLKEEGNDSLISPATRVVDYLQDEPENFRASRRAPRKRLCGIERKEKDRETCRSIIIHRNEK